MSKISPKTIDAVLTKAVLSEIVEKDTRIFPVRNSNGMNVTAFCPFHNDVHHASLSVNNEKGVYHCWTCDASGNVFGYVQERYGVSFPDAVEYVAKMYNIPVEYSSLDTDIEERQKTTLFQINEAAEAFFKLNYKNSPSVKEYAQKRRRFSEETVVNWGIGYAPKGGGLYHYLKSRKFSQEAILASGLVRESANGVTDIYYNRLMFPIRDTFGKILSFSGRDISSDVRYKYFHGTQTSIFKKGEIFFGLDMARKAIKAEHCAIFVEGQIDAISLSQNNIKNSVATMGTAITKAHLEKIKKYTDVIYLFLDGDGAGQKAALRLWEMLPIISKLGLNCFVVSLPDKLDPDLAASKFGEKYVRNLITKAMPISEFVVKNIIGGMKHGSAVEKNIAFIKIKTKIKPFVPFILAPQRSAILDMIHAKICPSIPIEKLYIDLFGEDKNLVAIEEYQTNDSALVLSGIMKYPQITSLLIQEENLIGLLNPPATAIFNRVLSKQLSQQDVHIVPVSTEEGYLLNMAKGMTSVFNEKTPAEVAGILISYGNLSRFLSLKKKVFGAGEGKDETLAPLQELADQLTPKKPLGQDNKQS